MHGVAGAKFWVPPFNVNGAHLEATLPVSGVSEEIGSHLIFGMAGEIRDQEGILI